MICWGITDGSAGMEAQVRALALALGMDVEMKTRTLKKPFARFPSALLAPFARYIGFFMQGDALSPPWPDMVISCGRKGALAAMGLRSVILSAAKDLPPRMTDGDPSHTLRMTKFIHIQDPQVNAKYFDVVIAMEHDHITGPNVIKTRFALHGITPQRLSEAAQHFAPLFAHYPEPRVAVLLGGSTNKYAFTPESMAQLLMTLQRVPGSLLITPSRRTGAGNVTMLRSVFAKNDHVYIYDGVAENPYMGMLALADVIIVTNDSVNMMSEAVATGKPVYILPLPGHSNTRPARFAGMLIAQNIARPLGNKLERWEYPPVADMAELADKVEKFLSSLRKQGS